ncbi:DNA replication and repair protein RecF [bacterium]|nr:DNA replication and repair protein RecF [bacterium]
MINRLSLTDFRNHALSRIDVSGARNVIITGPNGAGKTAVLEALSILSGDRGMRGAPVSDMARFGAGHGFAVHAELGNDTDIAVQWSPDDANRRAYVDGDTARLTDLAARVSMVWISPREDRIFVDSASERRAFFDRLAAAFDGRHAGRVARFSKLMTQRAGALKNGGDTYWLDALDTQIAAAAVAIAAARIQYAGEINYFLDGAAVSVAGIVENMILSDGPGAENAYLQYLRENRTLVGDKMVLDGPHKSDFGVFNQVLQLPAHLTSTGQQKSTLIELILAHAKCLSAKTSREPIILLDEAAAHLDAAARARMFSSLGAAHAQVWATGLDADVFRDVPGAIFVTCNNGEISNILHTE